MGTPNEDVWPGVSTLPNFKNVQWTQHSKQDLHAIIKYLDQVLDDTGMDLLYRLLTYDPTQRISAIQALKHDYFKDLVPPSAIVSGAARRL